MVQEELAALVGEGAEGDAGTAGAFAETTDRQNISAVQVRLLIQESSIAMVKGPLVAQTWFRQRWRIMYPTGGDPPL